MPGFNFKFMKKQSDKTREFNTALRAHLKKTFGQQAYVARRMGITSATLSKTIGRDRCMNLDTIFRLEKAAGIKIINMDW
jgi:plasmid maintenance system antidote protein VapI